MRNFLIGWAINALTLFIVANLLPGIEVNGGIGSLLLVALIIGLVNAIIRPLLYFLSCALIVLTAGLVIPLLNAGLLLLSDWLAGTRFEIDGLLWALAAAILMGIVNAILHNLLGVDDRKERRRYAKRR